MVIEIYWHDHKKDKILKEKWCCKVKWVEHNVGNFEKVEKRLEKKKSKR